MPKPPSITDREWKYTPSNRTNIRKTFARVRRELAEEQAQAQKTRNVTAIKRRGPA